MAQCCTGLFTSQSTPGPWPAVLVIHGGDFYTGSPDSSMESIVCAQDLTAAGYIAFSIEYRLAPPGALPGQISDGRFPDQTDNESRIVAGYISQRICGTAQKEASNDSRQMDFFLRGLLISAPEKVANSPNDGCRVGDSTK